MRMNDVEFKKKALEISIRSLGRYLENAVEGVASGSSSVWHIRKRANKEFVAIFGQMSALGAIGQKERGRP